MVFRALFLSLACFTFACFHRNPIVVNQSNQNPVLPATRLFETREPEKFQAELVFRSFDFKPTEKRIFITRDGSKRFIRFDDRLAQLQKDGTIFLINYSRKIFAESIKRDTPLSDDTPFDFFTSELLNRKLDSRAERIGVEDGLVKYSVRVGSSEVIVLYDEQKKLVIKQDFYSIEGRLLYSVVMEDLKFEVDESNFNLPSGFTKVSIEEFGRI